MNKAITVMTDNFNTIRTGRANPAILDRINVSTVYPSVQCVCDAKGGVGSSHGVATWCENEQRRVWGSADGSTALQGENTRYLLAPRCAG